MVILDLTLVFSVTLMLALPKHSKQLWRAQALEILKTYRDGGCKLPQAPSMDQVREMMAFLVGESLPDDYGQFLMGELSLDGGDPYAQPGMEDISPEKRRAFHVIIIGAGMSGILAAHRLKEAGISFTVIEKNGSIGGTWFENTYPGCRVDTPNHIYSYSFKPKNWPKYYSPQNVLLKYFNQCADEFGIRPHIRFNTSVESAEFDEKTYTWRVQVESADGVSQVLEAQAVISAVGQLNRPRLPDIEGRETFKSTSFHSARWEHGHDLTDKRVAVIGTGASAFQFIPEIAKQAGEVFVFQRTPNWIAIEPVYHDDIPEGKHWLLNHVPFYAKWFRVFRFWHNAEGVLAWVKRRLRGGTRPTQLVPPTMNFVPTSQKALNRSWEPMGICYKNVFQPIHRLASGCWWTMEHGSKR